MRSEKSQLLEEYRNKINDYEQFIQKNGMLRSFVEKWRKNVERKKDIVGFPEIIKNLALSLEQFYPNSITDRLEELVKEQEVQGETAAASLESRTSQGMDHSDNNRQPPPIMNGPAFEQVAEPEEEEMELSLSTI
uniref:DUF4201 domain-containing protein n=1 Tax=Mesocestoides corti TaxID=53468 RepID=A0A5K3EP31_MESCO